jgi:hypothetical protein
MLRNGSDCWEECKGARIESVERARAGKRKTKRTGSKKIIWCGMLRKSADCSGMLRNGAVGRGFAKFQFRTMIRSGGGPGDGIQGAEPRWRY